jgi:magnesium and cobalt transporter
MTNDRPGFGSWPKQWLGRLAALISAEPQDKEQLGELLRDARKRSLLDADALSMMEGVLAVAELRVRDIMIPRAQMVVVARGDALDEVLRIAIGSGHSRFPVIGEDRGEVVGLLLAKDLLHYCGERPPDFDMREVLRSAVFVPESKRLNVLLRELRASRTHMAIVVDEYGDAAGLVTIEDVLEQIVGEIEDEYDFDEGAFILRRTPTDFTLKAHTTVEEFNEYFGSGLDEAEFDTVGGLVIGALGHLPKRGEAVQIANFRFEVVRADSRRIRLLIVEVLPPETEEPAV